MVLPPTRSEIDRHPLMPSFPTSTYPTLPAQGLPRSRGIRRHQLRAMTTSADPLLRGQPKQRIDQRNHKQRLAGQRRQLERDSKQPHLRISVPKRIRPQVHHRNHHKHPPQPQLHIRPPLGLQHRCSCPSAPSTVLCSSRRSPMNPSAQPLARRLQPRQPIPHARTLKMPLPTRKPIPAHPTKRVANASLNMRS